MMARGRKVRRLAATALGVFTLALGAVVRADDWPAYLGGPAHSGTTVEGIVLPLAARWSVSLPKAVDASPVIAGDRVIVPCRDSKLYALNGADGSIAWSFDAGRPLRSTPAVSGGLVFQGGLNGTLYALRLTDGSVVWSKTHGGNQIGSPAVADGKVVVCVGSPSREVRAYDARTGELRWSADSGNLAHTSPAIEGSRVFVGAGNGQWSALDLATGELVWTWQGKSGAFAASASVDSGRVLIAPGQEDLDVYVFDAATGLVQNSFTPDLPPAPPAAKATVPSGKAAKGKAPGAAPSRAAETGSGTETVAGPSVDYTQAHPLELVVPEFQSMLLDMSSRADRESLIKVLESDMGVNLDRLREYLDVVHGDRKVDEVIGAEVNGEPRNLAASGEAPAEPAPAPAKAGKAGASSGTRSGKGTAPASSAPSGKASAAISPTGSVDSGTPILSGGYAYVFRRALGSVAHEYLLYKIDVTTGISVWAKSRIVPWVESPGHAPSVAISGGSVYAPMGDKLYIFDAADGTERANFAADGSIPGTPAIGNALVVFASEKGTVYALQGENDAPGVPSALSPSGGVNLRDRRPTMTWAPGSDPDAADPAGVLASEVQIAYGPDVDLDPVLTRRLTPGAASFTFDADITASTHVYYRVRTVDDDGAAGPWSAAADFWVNQDVNPPDPPTDVQALAMDRQVLLTWRPSPSLDAAGYRVRYATAGSGFGGATVIDAGGALRAVVTGLANYTTYDFLLTAVDAAGNESPGLAVSATPVPAITLNRTGEGYASLAAALAAAQAGDVVNLGVGTFTAGVAVPNGVVLRGVSPRLTVLTGGGAAAVLRVDGSRRDLPVAISNLAITDGVTGIDSGHAKVVVRNVVIARLAGTGVIGAPDSKVSLVNVTVADNGGDGISVPSNTLGVRNALVTGNARSGIRAAQGAQVHYADAQGNGLGDFVDVGAGAVGNFSRAIRYSVPAAMDYRELDGEPSVDAGAPEDPWKLEPMPNGRRINLGAFGNTPDAARTVDDGGKRIKKAGTEPGGKAAPEGTKQGSAAPSRRPAAKTAMKLAPGSDIRLVHSGDAADKAGEAPADAAPEPAEDPGSTNAAAPRRSAGPGASATDRRSAAARGNDQVPADGSDTGAAVATTANDPSSTNDPAADSAASRTSGTARTAAAGEAADDGSPAARTRTRKPAPSSGGCFLSVGDEFPRLAAALLLLLLAVPVLLSLRRRPCPARVPARR